MSYCEAQHGGFKTLSLDIIKTSELYLKSQSHTVVMSSEISCFCTRQ